MIRRPPRSTLFPTRRSSDLAHVPNINETRWDGKTWDYPLYRFVYPDRKSTRLNSSHSSISYAVFCLKKKKTEILARGPLLELIQDHRIIDAASSRDSRSR